MHHLRVDTLVLAGGLALAAGVLLAGAVRRLRVPGLLVFLALGMLAADDGLELVRFDDAELAQSIAIVALVLILFEGGLATSLTELRAIAAPATALSSLGTIATAGVVAAAVSLLLDVPASTAWLIGAVVASTDAAAVLSVLRRTPVPARLTTMLEAESGLNDPIALLLTVGVLTTWAGDADAGWWVLFGVRQLALGALLGAAAGWLGARFVDGAKLEGAGLHAVLAAAFAAIAYGGAALLGGSGLLAVYVTGVLIGNRARRHRDLLLTVHEGFSSLAQIVLFLMLGLLVFPSELPDVALEGVAITAVLVLVARPLGVVVAIGWMRTTWREVMFVSWAGLRGAVPIVLATFPITDDHPDGQLVFNLVFFVVLASVLVQGTTLVPLARALGLRSDVRPKATVLALDVPDVDVVELHLDAASRVVGRALRDVPMPEGIAVSVVVRDGASFVPGGTTELRAGDTLVVLANSTTAADALAEWASRFPTP